MKLHAVTLIVVLGMALAAGQAGAQIPGVIIYPAKLAEGQIVPVEAGTEVTVGVYWDACRIALVKIAARISHVSLWLDGAPWPREQVSSAAATQGVRQPAAEKEIFDCMGRADVVYGFAILYGLGKLPAGDHPARLVFTFDHPVTSAADQDGDGRPEIYRGTVLDRSFVIRVQEP
jgi:hypothetical protein